MVHGNAILMGVVLYYIRKKDDNITRRIRGRKMKTYFRLLIVGQVRLSNTECDRK